ncbi:mechanosensitive ion channel family protein [Tuberibacillus sp. Marseille-P3662]|uniref:mechanosensitive ion channel family protein n=1 Tax=Tuberibacillus sp. Marseille-P3662 TaxID=1965358 RepID=UPI000A1CB3DD|nr:mechanosensitive ion channel family protein [Tuberibacillus sp. Marseille-P3662]
MIDDLVNWFQSFNFVNIGIAVLIFILFWFLSAPISKVFLKFFTNLTTRTKTDWDNRILTAFHRPLNFAFKWLGIYFSLTYLPFSADIDMLISHLFRTILIGLVGWGLYNLADTSVHDIFYRVKTKYNFKFDQIVTPFITKVSKLTIIVLVITIIAYEWGYPINGLVAGMGLGGLAIALAAKDTLSNMFGGIIIITETPFTIGDWIETPSVQGIIEDINFRSTKVRTFEQSLVTVPNSTLANDPITNWSRMGKRQIYFHLRLHYHTEPQLIKQCSDDIRSLLHDHDDIDPEFYVHFYEFNPSSHDILLYFFTKSTNWDKWLSVREDINLKIMAILDRNGVKLALPSQDIFYQEHPSQEGQRDH